MARKTYNAKNANVSGPYSHAVDAGDFVYFSGQTAMNAANSTSSDMSGDIQAQTRQCFANLFDVLEASGLKNEDVVKVNVYLTSMKHFDAMNDVYETQFREPFPARTCVAVLELPLGAEVEIEMIARKT
ncbi:reactive intermediate/imine deaminase [Lentibacillus kapialis]|uniref:Reactive intermediate/imine deaminase n=1 Tax=Lentibacillus kapialis TaxID=340214 RepID=A0A917PWI1_9BACI|nr:Rid family detoxifying hydrolase [Lentibacillus kapialis]GGJ96525.1 reactive intermediate/imine deaminase [Lentibacillus kapialis]